MAARKPKVVLFLDDSSESAAAKKLLTDALTDKGLEFEVVPASGPGIPSARLGNTLYSGLVGVTLLAEGLRSA